MAWSQISGAIPQWFKESINGGAGPSTPASGYYIKFYNTSIVPIPMASDKDGGGQLEKSKLSTSGYPLNGSGNPFIPFIDQTYKIAFYKNADDADNDNTTSVDWFLGPYDPFATNTISGGSFDTIADLKAITDQTNGTVVNVVGHTNENDGGGGSFWFDQDSVLVDDNGLVIAPDDSVGRWIRLYDGDVNVRFFGGQVDGSTDDTVAIQGAANSGLNFFSPEGTSVITDEILLTTPSQRWYGMGAGEILADKVNQGWQTRIQVKIGTTVPKYIKTRRNARQNTLDAKDDPIGCMVNLESENQTVEHIFFELECDYGDTDSNNLGADCDVAIFNGCRGGTTINSCTWLGYFRVAGILCDVTRGTNLPEFQSPGGTTYPSTGTNGSDQIGIKRCQGTGAVKQIALWGPTQDGTGNYFDEATGIVSDTRGKSGASDFSVDDRSVVEGRDHHSGFRAYDPTLDPNTEDLDALSCGIFIDSVRGSTSQARVRRQRVSETRIRTIEAARIFTARCNEFTSDWIHTEPLSGIPGQAFDTSGNVIDPGDTATQSYGPIACQNTSGIDLGTNVVSMFGTQGTGIVPAHSADRVTDFTHTRKYINPDFTVTLSSDLNVGDDLVVGDRITAATLTLTTAETAFTPGFLFVTAPTFTVQVGKKTQIADMLFNDIFITYSGLDTADNSAVTINGIESRDTNSSFNVEIDVNASDGLVSPSTLYFGSNGTLSQLALFNSAGVAETYNGGNINAAGTIKLTVSYRV